MTQGDSRPFGAAHASNYAQGPRRQVPGLDGLHRMTSLLLAERVPGDGRVLVLGAGGGLELRYLAEGQPGWRFDGVDPSAEMLEAARQHVGSLGERMDLHQGRIAAAPSGPFDGAVCLLTFHFIPRMERLETLRQVRRRLVPGAPFVLAHISVVEGEPERTQWLRRHAAYGGTDAATAALSAAAMAERLTILSPDEEEAMLREAGFCGTELFYAAFSFRGWVAYA